MASDKSGKSTNAPHPVPTRDHAPTPPRDQPSREKAQRSDTPPYRPAPEVNRDINVMPRDIMPPPPKK